VGQDIDREEFDDAAFGRFRERLEDETALLVDWFARGRFSTRAYTAGFELEAWLLDEAARPAPRNEAFLRALGSDLVVPELSQFNFEVNGSPTTLQGRAFSRLKDELEHTWDACTRCAADLGLDAIMIGILPTVTPGELHVGNMSRLSRYRALNARLLELRQGVPFELRIDGRERFRRTHPDVMLEAAATSFQIHLQVRPDNAVRLYNASQAVAGVMVAVSANAPWLFGHDLWDESRIPLFEQAVSADAPRYQRVPFGHEWCRGTLLELFQENLEHYPVLIPALFDTGPEVLRHLRFHNGTIWRWNRPLIGFDHDGTPHLRIEHRVVPAGPTVADLIANAAFYYGLVAALALRRVPIEEAMPFAAARDNFYAGARHGLDARQHWPGADGDVPVPVLVLEELLPLARRGLAWLGIPEAEIDAELSLIEARVRSGRTGARWQRSWVERHGRDFPGLARAYLERQRTGVPVHRWAL
jgi:gamma-glutamyl:cysteine ligase YbdK (ATP-grasp superfamily)